MQQSGIFGIQNILDLARLSPYGMDIVEQAIALVVYPGSRNENTIERDLSTMVEIIKGLTQTERFELINVLVEGSKFRNPSSILSDLLVEFFTEISREFDELVFIHEATTVPSLKVALSHPNKKIKIVAKSRSLIEKIELWVEFLELKNLKISSDSLLLISRSFETDTTKRLLISVPPFGGRIDEAQLAENNENVTKFTRSDEFEVLSILNTGETPAIVVATDSLLFRGGATLGSRAMLVESGRLAGVVSLSSKQSFKNTNVGANLLLLKAAVEKDAQFRTNSEIYLASDRANMEDIFLKNPTKAVALLNSHSMQEIDSSGANVRRLTDISEKNYELMPDRYLATETSSTLEAFFSKYQTIELQNLVEIIRPIPIKEESGEYKIHELMISDYKNGEFTDVEGTNYKTLNIGINTFVKIRNQTLRKGDILISVKATIGKVTLISEVNENHFYSANQNMLILRLSEHAPIGHEALLSYLSNEKVTQHLDSVATGSTLKNLKVAYLKELKIPIPSQELQNAIKQNFDEQNSIYEEMKRLERELLLKKLENWPANELQSFPTLMK